MGEARKHLCHHFFAINDHAGLADYVSLARGAAIFGCGRGARKHLRHRSLAISSHVDVAAQLSHGCKQSNIR